ncbi:MAG: Panacea domain-containing protein [Coriobacteriia bacterium]|nr:Panacea domain-containing protein [Coriobacteriia bacterium]
MPKTEAVVCYLLKKAEPGKLSKTALLKLAYFADLESTRRFGRQLTDAAWHRDDFGAVAYEILNAARRVPGVQVYDYTTYTGAHGTDFCASGELGELDVELNPNERAILDEIFSTLGGLMAKTLGAMTKKSEPWLAAVEQDVAELDLSVVAPGPGDRFAHFAKVLETVDMSVRGTPEALAALDDDTERFMSPFRLEAIGHG